VDETEAQSSPQGRPVIAALSARGTGLARWSVESDDIEATSARLAHPVERRRRSRPDGTEVTWRSVAVDVAWDEPWRCAFMAWDDPATHPGRTEVARGNGATGFARLDVVVPDMATAMTWLGGQVPAAVALQVGEPPGIKALRLSSTAGEFPLS
jgi:hypothetical protein